MWDKYIDLCQGLAEGCKSHDCLKWWVDRILSALQFMQQDKKAVVYCEHLISLLALRVDFLAIGAFADCVIFAQWGWVWELLANDNNFFIWDG